METTTIIETTAPVVLSEEIMSETETEAITTVETARDFWTPEGLAETAPIMGKGMLGIFIVMGIIILCVNCLNKFSGSKKKKDKTQQN